MGTGNACAEHNKEIIESTSRSKRLLLESDEKTGALKPTGSGGRIERNWLTKLILRHPGEFSFVERGFLNTNAYKTNLKTGTGYA